MFLFVPINNYENKSEHRRSPTSERLSPLNFVHLKVPKDDVNDKKYILMSPFDITKNENPKDHRRILGRYYWEVGRQKAVNATLKRFNQENKNKKKLLPVDKKCCRDIIKSFLKHIQIKETQIDDTHIHAERSFNIDRVIDELNKAYFFEDSIYTEEKVRKLLNFNLNLYRNIDHV